MAFTVARKFWQVAAILLLAGTVTFTYFVQDEHNRDRATENRHLIIENRRRIAETCAALQKVHNVAKDLVKARTAPLDPNLITDPIVREAVRPFLNASNANREDQARRDLELLDKRLTC